MSRSTDPKVIGPKYPQCEKMCGEERGEYYYPAPWSVSKIPSAGELKTNPKVDCFELKYHAKVTDLISAIQLRMSVMLLSERFYQLLGHYNCMRSVVFESKVVHRKKIYPYRFLYCPDHHEHFIDFQKSRFYVGTATSSWLYDIHIDSFEAYKKEQGKRDEQNAIIRKAKASDELEFIRLLELYLDESKVDKDFFRLRGPMLAFLVSKRLKDAIESHGLTGMRFTPTQDKQHVTDFTVTPPRKVE